VLHDGTVPSVDAMFDPSRVTEAFAHKLHGAGPVSGHAYGLDLTDGERRDLITYVDAL
jgi:hypothetical protein